MQASDWLLQQIYDRLATNVELVLLPSKRNVDWLSRQLRRAASVTAFLCAGAV